MIFLFFDTAHHKRNEIKYMTSIALRKLNPINKPKSPPVLAKIKTKIIVIVNLLVGNNYFQFIAEIKFY